jgi:hypothetical protein
MKCPKCGHYRLRQIIEIVSAPAYAEDVMTTYPSYNYDYREWCQYLRSKLPKQESIATTTKIIGQQDIIELVDNALDSPLTINVLWKSWNWKDSAFRELERNCLTHSIMTLAIHLVLNSFTH